MFKKLTKRTKVLLGIAISLFVVALGLVSYMIASGGWSSFADTYWFPIGSENRGTIKGKVKCEGDDNCVIQGSRVVLNGVSALPDLSTSTDVSPDGSFIFKRVPLNTIVGVTANHLCPAGSGVTGSGVNGSCMNTSVYFTLTESNPTKDVGYITLRPYSGKLVVNVREKKRHRLPPYYGSFPFKNCDRINQYWWDCPVANASVRFEQEDWGGSRVTNSGGEAILGVFKESLYGGSVSLTVEKTGYTTVYSSANVTGCDVTVKTIYLYKK